MPDGVTLLPDTQNQAYVTATAAFIRAAIQFLSGVGFFSGTVSDNQILMAATAAVFVATYAWSAWQKFAAERRNKQSSIQSAVQSATATAEAGGIPTPIAVVSPKGAPP